ncbi:Hpt domain-containing protein [Tindallia californiensis]|nr:Hpt domain-containing protein [Tindallia californiensis]
MIDIERFMNEAEIDQETARELYGLFLDDLVQQKDSLEKQIRMKDVSEICRTVHSIKGIAGTYYACQLEKKAAFVERVILSRELFPADQCDALLEEIIKTIHDTKMIMER